MGEQVVKIGHKEAHNIICHRILFVCFGHDTWGILSNDLIFSRKFGKRDIQPNTIKIHPEIIFHVYWSIAINAVDTFRRKVNKIIDTTNDKMIVIILL